MEFSDEADVAKRLQETDNFLRLTKQAFEHEKAASDLMKDIHVEPSRGVLHRSAATLAWRCGLYDEAEKLVYRALAGDPRADIEWQLKDLLGTINLAKAGIHLSRGQLQFSLHGSEVGFGKALVTALTSRAPSIQKLLEISARSMLRKARDKVTGMLDDLGEVPVFIEGLEAGSCIVKLRLGEPNQEAFPGFGRFDEAIAPFMHKMRLLERGETYELEKTIQDPKEYRDFVNASITLAPDGDKISTVKFQAVVDEQLTVVSFSTTKSSLKDLPLPPIPSIESRLDVTEQDIVKTGVLLVGNADNAEKETECVLVTESGVKWHIEGDEDLKEEIVRKYYKRRIVVHGKRMKRARAVNHIQVSSVDNARLYAETDIQDKTTGAPKPLI